MCSSGVEGVPSFRKFTLFFCCFVVEMCLLSNRISDYPYVCQGKTRIPGVNDSTDGEVTDVREIVLLETGSELFKFIHFGGELLALGTPAP